MNRSILILLIVKTDKFCRSVWSFYKLCLSLMKKNPSKLIVVRLFRIIGIGVEVTHYSSAVFFVIC